MPVNELIPGVEPPIRLITALQDGVTKHSDVFICNKFLRALELDYCKDLLEDTNDALIWLEETNNTIDENIKRNFLCFSFDFKSPYNSLNPVLVIEALNHAMLECNMPC